MEQRRQAGCLAAGQLPQPGRQVLRAHRLPRQGAVRPPRPAFEAVSGLTAACQGADAAVAGPAGLQNQVTDLQVWCCLIGVGNRCVKVVTAGAALQCLKGAARTSAPATAELRARAEGEQRLRDVLSGVQEVKGAAEDAAQPMREQAPRIARLLRCYCIIAVVMMVAMAMQRTML